MGVKIRPVCSICGSKNPSHLSNLWEYKSVPSVQSVGVYPKIPWQNYCFYFLYLYARNMFLSIFSKQKNATRIISACCTFRFFFRNLSKISGTPSCPTRPLCRRVSASNPACFQRGPMDAQWMLNGCRMDAPSDIYPRYWLSNSKNWVQKIHLSKSTAKIQLFFDICKFFDKKSHFYSCYFRNIAKYETKPYAFCITMWI